MVVPKQGTTFQIELKKRTMQHDEIALRTQARVCASARWRMKTTLSEVNEVFVEQRVKKSAKIGLCHPKRPFTFIEFLFFQLNYNLR